MKILCSTCQGKGKIPDPQCTGKVMYYYGPDGEGVPMVFCQSCGGTGWVEQYVPQPNGWEPRYYGKSG